MKHSIMFGIWFGFFLTMLTVGAQGTEGICPPSPSSAEKEFMGKFLQHYLKAGGDKQDAKEAQIQLDEAGQTLRARAPELRKHPLTSGRAETTEEGFQLLTLQRSYNESDARVVATKKASAASEKEFLDSVVNPSLSQLNLSEKLGGRVVHFDGDRVHVTKLIFADGTSITRETIGDIISGKELSPRLSALSKNDNDQLVVLFILMDRKGDLGKFSYLTADQDRELQSARKFLRSAADRVFSHSCGESTGAEAGARDSKK